LRRVVDFEEGGLGRILIVLEGKHLWIHLVIDRPFLLKKSTLSLVCTYMGYLMKRATHVYDHLCVSQALGSTWLTFLNSAVAEMPISRR